jgi:hypothetical protein
MRNDFGNYGLDLNWLVTGTHDDNADVFDLMDRLYRCAAAIVRDFPERPLSLMNTTHQRFYVFNSPIDLPSLRRSAG